MWYSDEVRTCVVQVFSYALVSPSLNLIVVQIDGRPRHMRDEISDIATRLMNAALRSAHKLVTFVSGTKGMWIYFLLVSKQIYQDISVVVR